MKKIKVEESLDKALLHDITGVDENGNKTTIYKKSHIIKEEDISKLKDAGKYHVYVGDDLSRYIHEDEMAQEFANKINNSSIYHSKIQEGKINILANKAGVLKVDYDLVMKLNYEFEITLATKDNYDILKKDDLIASFRIIDLYWNKEDGMKLLELLNNQLFTVDDFVEKKVALLTIGSEIYDGRVLDLSLEKLNHKLERYHLNILEQVFLRDDLKSIETKLIEFSTKYDLIFCTGGMSVDPDDFTKSAILNVSDNIICNHTPYLPGSMFTISTLNNSIILGCPANVVFNDKTVLDIYMTRLINGDLPHEEEIMALGYGALNR